MQALKTHYTFNMSYTLLFVSGIKLMLELIPNHTSKKSKWFEESRKGGRDNNYKDYYVWANGRHLPNDTILPPNNWVSKSKTITYLQYTIQ